MSNYKFHFYFLTLFSAIFVMAAPVQWTGNEINYFQLSLMKVSDPGLYVNYSIFDGSNARFLPFYLIGSTIKILGLETAFVFLRMVATVLYAAAIAHLAKTLRVHPLLAVVAVMLFYMAGQHYFSENTLFGKAEAKVFAYGLVIAALGFMFDGRKNLALCVCALATYTHFLVGGFWGFAIVLFLLIEDRNWRSALRNVALFAVLIFPLVTTIGLEQLRPVDVDLSGVNHTANFIYAEIRNPHHIAPFSSLDNLEKWVIGFSYVFSSALLVLYIRSIDEDVGAVALWLVALYGYLVLAFILAFLDRKTHIFSAFYLFRPNKLILLLTLFVVMASVTRYIERTRRETVLVIFAIVAVPFFTQYGLKAAYKLVVDNKIDILKEYSADQRQMIDWVVQNTNPQDVVLIEDSDEYNMDNRYAAFESVVGRPTLVNYKFVPTLKSDIYRWYKLITWRRELFSGRCELIDRYPVTYLLFLNQSSVEKLSACSDVVWTNGQYTIARAVR